MLTENGAANAKQERDKIFSNYVENNCIEIYVDYNNKLSDDQIQSVLDGKTEEVRLSIEDDYAQDVDSSRYYWEIMADELKVDKQEIMDWLQDEGFYPSAYLDDTSWSQLLGNSRTYITGTMWNVEFNFNGWAYGQPLTYSDVKDALKVLNVNPAEFKALRTGGSATSGEGQFRGYFPNMPKREAAVNIKDLYDNLIALYDGVLNFCLSDLAEAAEVLQGDSKYVTFKAGTNIVMYQFGNGAGITDAKLIKDVTVKRSEIEFRNDGVAKYGIQECYGFVSSFWSSGGMRDGK